ncbi:MAG: polymer-forming cytoskeletal protein [Flavobacteriaceae bacterium]|jgi:cytoskeletal protein CcmA (bactofilin family)|nr:polymer-forming cytoskeletal protein [Flavobacteriaceae bacterium]MDG1284984.1 polymer-forming cytoskeletal protein [Flavobacteriaceae bacterium]
MFAENKKSNSNSFSQQNTIAQGTTFTGDLTSEGDFRIEGVINGSLTTSGKVVIGKTGALEGVLICDNADMEGKFKGTLNVSDTLNLRSSAHIEGEVQIGKLSVEPGATFNASCLMKSSVKELKNEPEETALSQNNSQSGQSA